MRQLLIRYFVLSFVVTVLAALVLLLFPNSQGFTITSMHKTRFYQGGVLISALLMIGFDLFIAATLIYELLKAGGT